MDPFRFTTIAHAERDLLGPLSTAGVDAMLDRVAPSATRVLDVGCGKGEMLVRAIERLGGHGVGVEPNPAFAAQALERAATRLPAGAMAVHEAPLADVALPERGFDLAMCAGATHAFGTPDEAMAGLARLAAPGALVLVGDGYWRQRPHPEYAARLGGEDSMRDHAGNAARGREHGLACEWARESTLEEWDAYEEAYASAVRQWCDANPGDPDAPAFRERIEAWHGAYRRWGRDTLGFGLYLFRVPA